MSYLLGFPSPVIEVILVLVIFVLGCALYFGYRFETVDIVERDRVEDANTVSTGKRGDE